LGKISKKSNSKKTQGDKSLKGLVNLACEFKELEEVRSLYDSIENLIKNEFSANEFLVYSKPSKVENPEYLRIHWNKKKVSKYNQEYLEFFLGIIKKEKDNFNTHISEIIKEENYYCLPIGVKDDQFFFCVWKCDVTIIEDFTENLIKFIETRFTMIKMWEEIAKDKELIYRDDVTNLFNQRKLTIDLESSISRYHKFKENFSVLFIDIDHFKSVNDGYGHLIGTKLLSDMALVLQKVLRTADLVYRYGGDEFVVILPATDLDTGTMIAERVLIDVKAETFYINESEDSKKLSVSIGVAEFPKNARNQMEILAIADKMMYEAKESGRGKVITASAKIQEFKR
jgi:diguanylate cyclase (GGDEF)-like protein